MEDLLPKINILDINVEFLKKAPFASTFQTWNILPHHILLSRHVEMKAGLHAVIKADAIWAGAAKAADWSQQTCGLELCLDDQIELLIDILWLIFCEDTEGAYDCIVTKQYQVLAKGPTKMNAFTGPPKDNDEEVQNINHDVVSSRPILTARNHTEWNEWLKSSQAQRDICAEWTSDLLSFFHLSPDIDKEHPTSLDKVVMDLREMRAVSSTIWKMPMWSLAVKQSKLANAITLVCRPDTLLETSSVLIAHSFRHHRWKESFGSVLDLWTPLDAFTVEVSNIPPFKEPTTQNVLKFFEALCVPTCVIPTQSNPSSVFFLVNPGNFIDAWDTWLRATLMVRGINPRNWNPADLHREIRGLDVNSFEKKHPGVIHHTLRVIIRETTKLISANSKITMQSFRPRPACKSITPVKKNLFKASNSITQSVRKAAHKPVEPLSGRMPGRRIISSSADILNTCKICSKLPREERCIMVTEVEETSAVDLQGAVLTCAASDDRMSPKKGDAAKVQYYRPDELGMHRIAHRERVFKRCSRDVNFIWDRKGKKMVGGVQFGPFSRKALGHLLEHHHRISRFKPVKRGGLFQLWAYGKMRAIGSRAAQGGRPGDAYTLYAGMEGRTEEDIVAMFSHAHCADALVRAARAMYPPLTGVIGQPSQDVNTDPLGSTGSNIFACNDYMAPLHVDNDEGLSICSQLQKHSRSDEFNFAYSKWNVYIETIPNCIWLFYSDELHGTIMPRASSWNAPQVNVPLRLRGGVRVRNALSTGDHVVLRRTDVARANQYRVVRHRYQLRSQYWL